MLRNFVKNRTAPLRFWLIEKLSPTVWKQSQEYDEYHWLQESPRPSTLYAKDHFKNQKVNCIEVGVGTRANALAILQTLNVSTIQLIDPYNDYVLQYWGQTFHIDPAKQEEIYQSAKKLLEAKGFSNFSFIRKTSIEAVETLQPNSADYIYLDGWKDDIANDLNLYLPILKEGGIMAGHDFTGDWQKVAREVIKFTDENEFYLMTKKADWWFIKC